mgnify:FL=1
MTDYESFREQLKNSLQKFVGRDAMLGYSEFYKNGGYCYEGICLRGSQADMMPILNIREYYQYFLEHNRNLDEVMVRVKKELADAEHTEADLLWRVRPFEEIRKNICFGLVHYETNRQRLKDLAHERFLDLAVVFYLAVFKEGKFYASMLITGTLAELWGMDGRALYELALENAGKQPVVTIRLQANEHLPEGMIFLTNRIRCYGAACILYPGVLRSLAGKEKRDLYIILAGIHGAVLVPVGEKTDIGFLKEKAAEFLKQERNEADWLSGHLYRYIARRDAIVEVLP